MDEPSLYNSTNTTSTSNSSTVTNTETATGDSYASEAFYEFVIFMLPCFIFLFISYKKLRLLSREKFTKIGVRKQQSYYIKKALCLFHVFIFVVQMLLAAVQKKENWWVAEHRWAALVYLFEIVAWVLSMKLLDKEVERGIPQLYFEHRMFWVLSFAVACIKMAKPIERLLCPLLINIAKIIGGLILTLYAIAKPFDSEEADEAQGHSNPLPFIRDLLVKIEEAQCTNSLIGEIDYEKGAPFLDFSSRKSSFAEPFAHEFKDFMKQHKIGATTSAQAGDWLKDLPIVTCSISKNVVAKDEAGGKTRVFYEITTNVDNKTFETMHNYKEFVNLEEYIKKRCDPAKISWIDRSPPEFEKVEVSNYKDEKSFVNARIEILERWLNVLGADPRYMNDRVIEFLGIEEPWKSGFLKYLAYLASTNKKTAPTPRANQQNKPMVELTDLGTSSQRKRRENEGFIPKLRVKCSQVQKSMYGDHYEYIVVVIDEKAHNSSWTLTKSYGDFKTFNDDLEKALDMTIPYFGQYVPKPMNQKQTMEPSFVEKRRLGLEQYMNMILKQPAYHTKILYEFLEYDTKKRTHGGSVAGGSFTPGEKRKQIRQVRKLIPSRSKVFPKDFFQIDTNQVSSSVNLPSGLLSPRFLTSNKPNSEPFASAKPSRVLCSPLMDPEKTTRHLWSANNQQSSDKSDTETDLVMIQKDMNTKTGRVLRDLLNINYNTTITINNNGSSQPLEIEKKIKSENILDRPVGANGTRKKRMTRGAEYFISITEADENTVPQPQPISLKGKPFKLDFLNVTPGFKNIQHLPALKKETSGVLRRGLSQKKLEKPELQTERILLSNLSPLGSVLNPKPQPGLRAELSAAWKNQRGIRRSDLVGVNLKPEMNETKVPLSRKKFLPSIVKNH